MPRAPIRLALAVSLAIASAGTIRAQVWEVHNQLLAPPLGAQNGAEFGYSLGVGDVDGDGYVDLVVGEPFRDLMVAATTYSDAGRISIFRGGPGGLDSTAWFVDTLSAFNGSWYGFSLVVADFDDDGRAEIAVGLPHASAPKTGGGTVANVGLVLYLDYDPGLDSFSGGYYKDYGADVPASEANDQFGWSLAAGDFDHDGYLELAVGSPYENTESPSTVDSGQVSVFAGSQYGPVIGLPAVWTALDAPQNDCEFGYALATTDFDHDGYVDLAIGEPGRTLSTLARAGRVLAIYGSSTGLTPAGSQFLSASSFGFTIQAGEEFGSALAAADFDFPGLFPCLFGACYGDLAIGAPGYAAEPFGSPVPGAGRVVEVAGSASGLDTASYAWITQESFGSTLSELNDGFGSRLFAGEVDRLLGTDLAIGSPYEDDTAGIDVGGAYLAFGGSSGIGSHFGQVVYERPGFASAPARDHDYDGWAVAIGDFNGDGTGDLAVGIIGYPSGGQSYAGAVQVLYGALFADGFERGNTSGWSAHAP